MLFWFAIIVGLLFAWLGIRMGFYMVFQSFFNVLIAIYLGVMTTPWLIGLVPELGGSGYNTAACVLGIALVVFIILQTITACFLTGISDVEFPGIFDNVGAGTFGFILGYVAVSFVLFVIYIMPVSRMKYMTYAYKPDTLPACAKSTSRACEFVGAISLQYHDKTVSHVVDWLIDSAESDDTFQPEINASVRIPAIGN